MDRAVDFDLRFYLPGDILTKVDRAAMANGLETRAPFLDVDLVEFVLSLPWQMRFIPGMLKGILRDACADLWPKAVAERPKQGFGGPVSNWLKLPEVQQIYNEVTSPQSALHALFPELRNNVSAYKSSQQAWNLLCLGLWINKRTCYLNNL